MKLLLLALIIAGFIVSACQTAPSVSSAPLPTVTSLPPEPPVQSSPGVPATPSAAEIAQSVPSPTATVDAAQPTATSTTISDQQPPVPTALPVRAETSANEAEASDLVRDNSAFAFDLYRTLSARDGNLFYSPYSISIALGMTYAGARGETERQMADTLHFDLPQTTLHTAFNTLYLDLESRSGGAKDNDPSAFRLNIANALWGQRGYRFRDEFTTVIAENYGTEVQPTDFVGQPEESRIRINDWVASETEDRITDLIPSGTFEDRPPALVLTNAIYFNAAWVRKFKAMLRPTDFHRIEGDVVALPMMKRTGEGRYASGVGYQAVEMQYMFARMSMTILLPDQGTFEAFEDSLDDELVARVIEDLETREVVLTMPKFEFQSEFDLVDTLKAMGMTDAFDSTSADFSGMGGRSCLAGDIRCLFLSGVIHKAVVSVDEEGTEAAAATGMIVFLSSREPGLPVEVTVDRPFIFLIRDGATGTILFVGRVLDPSM